MNDIARAGGYFVDVGKSKNNSFTVKIGKGFAKSDKDTVYIIKYDNEFCTLYKIVDGKEKQEIKRDISTEIRAGLSPSEFIENIKTGLIDKLCTNYCIDKSYVYYEEE